MCVGFTCSPGFLQGPQPLPYPVIDRHPINATVPGHGALAPVYLGVELPSGFVIHIYKNESDPVMHRYA